MQSREERRFERHFASLSDVRMVVTSQSITSAYFITIWGSDQQIIVTCFVHFTRKSIS